MFKIRNESTKEDGSFSLLRWTQTQIVAAHRNSVKKGDHDLMIAKNQEKENSCQSKETEDGSKYKEAAVYMKHEEVF